MIPSPSSITRTLDASLEAEVLAVGVTETQRHERSGEVGKLVQLHVHGTTAIFQLHDPEHFNTFSAGLGEDMRCAVQHISTLSNVTSALLQGSGPHFSVGGNPYAGGSSTPVSSAAFALRRDIARHAGWPDAGAADA